MSKTAQWEPYRESLGVTLARTGAIAVVLGGVLATMRGGGWARWPVATLLALWPALGGHFVELWFLNWLRPRIARSRVVQVAARVGVWSVGGVVLLAAMWGTATVLGLHHPDWRRVWWIGGLGFVGVELIAHLALFASGRPSFYDGRG